jgi:PAS domain S-box-containing protein
MAWQFPPFLLVHTVVCLAMVGIAVAAYRNREIAGSVPLTGLAALVAVWALGAIGHIARTDYLGQVVFGNLTYFPIAVVPVLLLYFAESYTGHETVLTRYGPLPLLVVPAATQVVVWTNPAHGLFFASREVVADGSLVTMSVEWGAWFWVHGAYSYTLLTVASYHLLRTLVVSEDVYSMQAAALLVGVFTPWVSNALYLGGLLEVTVDPTPIAFSITVAAFVVAIYRHRLLQMVPVARELARDELMDSLVEGVVVLDERERIVDCNQPALGIFGRGDVDPIGEPLGTVAPDLAAALDDLDADGGTPARAEVALQPDGTLRYYDVRVTRLRRGGGVLSGRLVSLRDVTERRQREQRLDVLNRTLRHDLRNEANVVLGYAELGQQKHPDAEWLAAIRDHVSGMVDLSEKVRQIEQALDDDHVDTTTVDAVTVVESVVTTVAADRPDLDIGTDLPASAPVRAVELLDAAVRNAVENAVEHNDNPDPLMEVAVSVTREGDTVSITVTDNGPGIHADEQAVLLRGRETQLDHVSGLGLWMINWIVTKSGGEIEIGENDPRGSVVTIRLPAADGGDADAGERTARIGPEEPSVDGERTGSVADEAATGASNASPDGGPS